MLQERPGGTTLLLFPEQDGLAEKLLLASPVTARLLMTRSSTPVFSKKMLSLFEVPESVIGNVTVLPELGKTNVTGAMFTLRTRLLPESAINRSWTLCGLLNTAKPGFWIKASVASPPSPENPPVRL